MSICKRIKRALSGYIDNEISRSRAAMIAEHLEKCPSCSRELSELFRIKELIAHKQLKVLPQDYLVYRLREQIALLPDAGARSTWLAGMGGLSRRLIPLPVAAVVLSIAFLVLSSGRPANTYALENHILGGYQTTTETALKLILGI